jgi:hypothetical protein
MPHLAASCHPKDGNKKLFLVESFFVHILCGAVGTFLKKANTNLLNKIALFSSKNLTLDGFEITISNFIRKFVFLQIGFRNW